MFRRLCLLTAAVAATAPFFTGCSASQVDSISVTPAAQTIAVGQTAQFTATGTTTHGQHPSSTTDVTNMVTWTSSAPAVATISSSGLVTAVSGGTTTIAASMKGFTGNLSATAVVTVTGSGGGTGGGGTGTADITSVTIIPGSQAVAAPGQTSSFIAIGATSTGATEALTSQVLWTSSSNQIATINSAGVATAASKGTATITALFTNPDKSIATGTATFQVIGGTTEQVTALSVYPNTQSLLQAQQSQFFVLGTQGATGLQVDETSAVQWSSSNTNVVTVGTSGSGTPGLVTAVGAGTATITATYINPDKTVVVATATVTVTIGAAQEPLLSIQIVPGSVVVSNKGMTTQYLAFGTFSTAPTVRDITNSVTWFSSLPEVAEIDSCGAASSGPGIGVCPNGGTGPVGPSGGLPGEYAGLATSMGYTGDSVIYALDNTTNPDGTVVLSNPQTFTCRDQTAQVCIQTVPTPQFATITVYIQGEQTFTPDLQQMGTDGLPWGEYVTAPSDTNVKDLIHCGREWNDVGGKGGQVCTGTYAVGTTVKLTENLAPGSTSFGGWSTGSSCQEAGSPTDYSILATSTTCTVKLNGNASVGVIFY